MLRIAEALAADGQDADALEWLGRGLAEFAPDSRLRDLAADCHLRAGRVEEALELLWANFTHRPEALTYQRLCLTAGTGRPSWRERALELLRAQPRAAGRSAILYDEMSLTDRAKADLMGQAKFLKDTYVSRGELHPDAAVLPDAALH